MTGGGNNQENILITFDDMSTINLTITQLDAGHITGIQGVVGGVAGTSPTVSHIGTGFSVRVIGEEGCNIHIRRSTRY